MQEAIDVYRTGELADVPVEEHTRALYGLATRRKLSVLKTALEQRYPEL